MAIFVDQNTKVIVQGLTGGQGRFHGLRNKAYGTQPRGCLDQTVQELLVRVNAISELPLVKLRNYQVRADQMLESFHDLELSHIKRSTN